MRAAIDSYGFGAFIRHSSGHGAGFGTLDHTARPRLHPKSEDVLEPGMVLKLELGIYSEAAGGVRKSEMLAITEEGAEPLTPFQWSLRDVIIAN